MNDPVLITEVISRSGQGTTRPFLCRGENDCLYYVKGRYAGLRSLCCEWVAARLAQEMGLTTPDIAVVELSRDLIRGSDRPDIQDLGEGLAFGSTRIAGAQEVTWESVRKIPSLQRAHILFFDWWVRNEDRTLSVLGGNPNLLLSPSDVGDDEMEDDFFELSVQGMRRRLWTFDFNLAFDPTFNEAGFWQNHVFAEAQSEWSASFQSNMRGGVERALSRLPGILAELPPEWLHIDADPNLPVQLDADMVWATLRRPLDGNAEEFWIRKP